MRGKAYRGADRDEKIAEAKRLLAAGRDFTAIGEVLGVDRSTARVWADPVYARERRERINQIRRGKREGSWLSPTTRAVYGGGPSKAELKKRLLDIPEDTRSLTGRLLGDPLPGRSA